MCNDLVPLLVLVLAPLFFFAPKLGLTSTPILRRALFALAAGLVWLRLPPAGLDAPSLDRVKLFLAAWTILVVVARWQGLAILGPAKRYRAVLVATAAFAVLAHTNFLSFHNGAFVQYHDVAHYYVGARYFPELGYGRLYTAMLRAEAETTGGFVPVPRARDLETNAVVPVETLLAKSDAVKASFSPERWEAFRADVAGLHQAMGGSFGALFEDHGFNPTPLWPFLGRPLASLVTPGSQGGLLALALLDPLLLAIAFAAVGFAFGLETALLAATYASLVYGASFDWLGGAFLRQIWLTATLVSAAALAKGRPALAGAALALATVLRVFPGFFAAGFFVRAALETATDGRPREDDLRFLGGFVATGLALVAITLPYGLGPWLEFVANTRVHMQSLSSNTIGLTNVLAYSRDVGVEASGAGLDALVAWRATLYRIQLVTLFPLSLAVVALLARRASGPVLLAAGAVPLVAGLTLSAYYYLLLVVLLVAHSDRLARVALVFAVEFATYLLALFEAHEPVVYLYRGLLVLYLLVGLHAADVTRAVRETLGPRLGWARSPS